MIIFAVDIEGPDDNKKKSRIKTECNFALEEVKSSPDS